MSLEEKLDSNTAALDRLTAALQGKATSAVAGVVAGTKVPPKAAVPAKPKKTTEEVMAMAVQVKNTISQDAAKFLIAKHGAAALKELKPAAYDAFYADCEVAIEAGAVEGMEPEAEADGL